MEIEKGVRIILQGVDKSADGIIGFAKDAFRLYSLSMDKVLSFTTDEAPTEVSVAHQLSGRHIPSVAHRLSNAFSLAIKASKLEDLVESCKRLVSFMNNPAGS